MTDEQDPGTSFAEEIAKLDSVEDVFQLFAIVAGGMDKRMASYHHMRAAFYAGVDWMLRASVVQCSDEDRGTAFLESVRDQLLSFRKELIQRARDQKTKPQGS